MIKTCGKCQNPSCEMCFPKKEVIKKSNYHSLLIDAVSNGDLHTTMYGLTFSTSLRKIITVEDMEDRYRDTEGKVL